MQWSQSLITAYSRLLMEYKKKGLVLKCMLSSHRGKQKQQKLTPNKGKIMHYLLNT
jgi:hypothetical protein